MPTTNALLLLRVRQVVSRLAEARDTQGKLPPGAARDLDVSDAEIDKCLAELTELEQQVPRPPRSYDDLVILALIAQCGAEVRNGTMAELDGDIFERPAARLVEAVLQFESP
jgi:hypothetical protein